MYHIKYEDVHIKCDYSDKSNTYRIPVIQKAKIVFR